MLSKNKIGVEFIKVVENNDCSNKMFLCKCPECGKENIMWASHFYRGSNSCKCYALRKKHKRLYGVWVNIKTRCENPNVNGYENYGGRGISVCDEWQKFKPFMEWAYANGYDENATRGECTLDRINVNGNYEPSNCRWISMKKQGSNKRNNVLFYLNGEQISFKSLCEELNLNYKTEHNYYTKHGYEKELNRLKTKSLNFEISGCLPWVEVK